MTAAEILAILTGVNATLGLVQAAIQRGKERGEWSPAEEAQFEALQAEIGAREWWKRTD